MQLGDPGNGERLLYNGKGIDEVGAVMALGEKDGSDWKLAAGGAATDLDAALKSEGHEFDSFALDIHIPAQCGVREAAVLSHMRRAFPEEQLLSKPHRQVAESIFSLRDTWRAAMMPALQEAVHGAALDLESDMRCGIYFVHRGTSRETSILKLNRSRKRRRGKPKDIPLSPEEITRSLSKNAFDAIFALSSRDLELAGVKGGELFVPEFPVQVLLRSFRRPVHVGGYYRKLRRNISNSPWTIDGSRKGETSVQEAIGDLIAPALRADSYNMISAGREDIDVLMLGKGRPFVLEYQNARSKMPGADFFRGVEEQLVSSGVGVEASGLQVIGKELLKELKAGESEKQKRYLALVRLDREVTAQDMAALSDMKDLTLAQRTPVRVSHRRADLVREKMVYEMSCEAIDSASPALAGTSLPEGVAEADKPRMFWLLLRTSAGTYIKEFVHGDEEDGEARTTPNVGSLLNARAEILQLDVLEVVMDWL
ncbi:unnamed protein product [Pedinophyceae sp. YPF-701]|nr:unnamed protein product [Pedinophyceae sp. YPF-701]